MQHDFKEDISFIKNELESLNDKVDSILEIMNNLSIMFVGDDEDIDDLDDSWVPDQDDYWNNHEDES